MLRAKHRQQAACHAQHGSMVAQVQQEEQEGTPLEEVVSAAVDMEGEATQWEGLLYTVRGVVLAQRQRGAACWMAGCAQSRLPCIQACLS